MGLLWIFAVLCVTARNEAVQIIKFVLYIALSCLLAMT